MSATIILTFSFIAEMAVVSIGFAIYLYRQVQKLKKNAADAKGNDTEQNLYNNINDVFDEQIKLTQQQIAKHARGEEGSTHRGISSLLSKRVEILQLEKEVSGQEVKDQAYWKSLCARIAAIIVVKKQKAPDSAEQKPQPKLSGHPENADENIVDDAEHRKKILRYQEQIATLYQEFEDYRKANNKLINLVSGASEDVDADALMKELMADIKDHDDRLQASLSKIRSENERLEGELGESEKSAYKLDYELHKKNKNTDKAETEEISTAAELEISNLRGIIDRQHGSLDELKQAMENTQNSDEASQMVAKKLEAVEKSQTELMACVEVLEMDNDRLVQALEDAKEAASNAAKDKPETTGSAEAEQDLVELNELRLKSKEHVGIVDDLTTQLEEKENKITTLNEEFASLQDEFMRIYEKQNEA